VPCRAAGCAQPGAAAIVRVALSQRAERGEEALLQWAGVLGRRSHARVDLGQSQVLVAILLADSIPPASIPPY